MLADLAVGNPARLTDLQALPDGLRFTLLATPAAPLDGFAIWLHDSDASTTVAPHRTAPETLTRHAVHLHFPRFYPAVPMEAYLGCPVAHPNVHPQNGFVCLWAAHRIANNAEHAVHKLAAVLGWSLLSTAREHSMQPELLSLVAAESSLASVQQRLYAPPLRGIVVQEAHRELDSSGKERRKRLHD